MKDLFLDSGAFSAYNIGKQINIDQLIAFYFANKDVITCLASLDIISTTDGDEDACAQGWDNYKYMLSKGVPKEVLLPVFHRGDNFYWLEKMRDEKVPYLGLSPKSKSAGNAEKRKWLEECMYYVTDRTGLPLMKWHGFAVTSPDFISRFPFYSVDSTSAMAMARYGKVFVPPLDSKGAPVWNKITYQNRIGVSANEEGLHCKYSPEHMNNLSPFVREVYIKYFKNYLGLDYGESHFEYKPIGTPLQNNQRLAGRKKADGTQLIETIKQWGISNSSHLRVYANVRYFSEWMKTLPLWPWPYKKQKENGLLTPFLRGSATEQLSDLETLQHTTKMFIAGSGNDLYNQWPPFANRDFMFHQNYLTSFAYPNEALKLINCKRRYLNENRCEELA